MDRAEAEAIYDAGRDACVTFLLELTAGYERQIAALEERLDRLEAQARQDSPDEFEAAVLGSAEVAG